MPYSLLSHETSYYWIMTKTVLRYKEETGWTAAPLIFVYGETSEVKNNAYKV